VRHTNKKYEHMGVHVIMRKTACLPFINLKFKFCFWRRCTQTTTGLCPGPRWGTTVPSPSEIWTPDIKTKLLPCDGDPYNGACRGGVWKNRDFRPICRFISEMIQDRAILTMTNRKSFMVYRTAPFSMTLNNVLQLKISRSRHFDAEYLRNGIRNTDSYNEIRIGTYTRPTQRCHFEWPGVTFSEIINDTKHVCLRQLSFLLTNRQTTLS